MNLVDAERVLERSIPEPNSGCWVWLGSLTAGGYGTLRYSESQKKTTAHRVSYAAFKCDIPDELDLDHLCRVRCCVNPDHLEPVTRQVNLERGVGNTGATQRARTHCPQGHEYTPENTRVNRKGQRSCKACTKEMGKRWYYRNLHIVRERKRIQMQGRRDAAKIGGRIVVSD